jgi:hypothetical protein
MARIRRKAAPKAADGNTPPPEPDTPPKDTPTHTTRPPRRPVFRDYLPRDGKKA